MLRRAFTGPVRPMGGTGALLLALLYAAACLGSGPASAATKIVNVSDFVFTPSNLVVTQGDVVQWQYVGGIMHTTTSGSPPGTPNGLWNAPIDPLNTTFSRQFNTPGTFPYYCAFHYGVGMTGVITVLSNNAAPVVANPGPQTGQEEQPFTVTVFASDANGDPLTMSDLGTTPAWAAFVDNGNGSATISGTPALGDAGAYNQSVRASDGTLSDTEVFSIFIAAAPLKVVNLTGTGFDPDTVAIDVGESIRWIKDTGGNHTTTSGTGLADPNAGSLWDAELRVATPQFEHLFTVPGTYPYFCRNHAAETGTVIVNDTTAAPFDVEILASGISFTPRDVVIQQGQTVKWTWMDGVHTTTSGVSSSPEHNPGLVWDDSLTATHPSFLYTFNVPGFYPYFCRIHEVMDMKGTVTVQQGGTLGIGDDTPRHESRFSAYPNPFSTSTVLTFRLDAPAHVRIDVFTLNGRLARNFLIGEFPAGDHRFSWDGLDDFGRRVADGVYFIRFQAGDGLEVRKVFKTR